MTEAQRRRMRIGRDTAIVIVALGWGTAELLFLGARPGALAFITSVLVSPLVLRYDEARRNGNGGGP